MLSGKRTVEFLRLNRYYESHFRGLLTGHCHFAGNLFKLRITASPVFGRCKKMQIQPQISYVSVCVCVALAKLRFRH
jgi:hypothetical protein